MKNFRKDLWKSQPFIYYKTFFFYSVFACSDEAAVERLNHRISIASPNEKNRYRLRIASSYAARICSFPAKADTSISRVDSGRWKFVISPSIILNV